MTARRTARVGGLAMAIAFAAAAPAAAEVHGVIETPVLHSEAPQPVTISGWMIDSASTNGTGVDVVDVWACPTSCNGSNGIYLGIATYGLPRPDIAAQYGHSRFTNSGFTLTMTGLAPGVYFLYVGAHSTVTGQWVQFAWSFTATAHPISWVETPASGASVGQPFALSGWAIDQAAATGTGVDDVDVWAYPNPGSGASAVYWGPTTLGGSRPAVGAQYGAQFTNSGFTLTVTGKAAGSYLMQVGIRSAVTGTWTIQTRQAYVDLPTVALLIDRQGTGTGGISASGLTCPGGSGTQAVPCGASYTLQTVVTLVPQPDAGSSFGGWTGACSGLGACQLTMSQARFASAQFIKAPSTLAPSYYHVDAIGSVRAITDQSGATVIRHDYFPFGEDTQPLTGDPMRFGGTELDPESGLNYMVARNYRNTWGRFLSVDPVGGTLTNPQRWNGYAYALNNPLRFVDRNGMFAGNPCPNGNADGCMDTSEYFCWANYMCQPGYASAMQAESEWNVFGSAPGLSQYQNYLNEVADGGTASGCVIGFEAGCSGSIGGAGWIDPGVVAAVSGGSGSGSGVVPGGGGTTSGPGPGGGSGGGGQGGRNGGGRAGSKEQPSTTPSAAPQRSPRPMLRCAASFAETHSIASYLGVGGMPLLGDVLGNDMAAVTEFLLGEDPSGVVGQVGVGAAGSAAAKIPVGGASQTLDVVRYSSRAVGFFPRTTLGALAKPFLGPAVIAKGAIDFATFSVGAITCW